MELELLRSTAATFNIPKIFNVVLKKEIQLKVK